MRIRLDFAKTNPKQDNSGTKKTIGPIPWRIQQFYILNWNNQTSRMLLAKNHRSTHSNQSVKVLMKSKYTSISVFLSLLKWVELSASNRNIDSNKNKSGCMFSTNCWPRRHIVWNFLNCLFTLEIKIHDT